MNPRWYSLCRTAGRTIRIICIRQHVLEQHRSHPDGPLLLAVTHLSHLEPVVLMTQLSRPIHWMARIEFFNTWWGRLLLARCGSFPVDRAGFSLPAIRRSISLLAAGRDVGIFPEGSVSTGPDSVIRGGPIKHGVCTVSIRTGVPIVPVVVLGTHRLNTVDPWLPVRRGRTWTAFGEPVHPPPTRKSNRALRAEMAERLRAEFAATYQRLLTDAALRDSDFP